MRCDDCLRARPQLHHTMLSGAEVALTHVHGDEGQHKNQNTTDDGYDIRDQGNDGFYSINFVAGRWCRCGGRHGRFLLSFNGICWAFYLTPASRYIFRPKDHGLCVRL